jgi:hypothetical protein
MKRSLSIFILISISLSLFFSSCDELFLEETPTKTRMQGIWKVTEVYSESDSLITPRFEFPITAFWLSDDNSIMSSAGPLMMYIVYGENNYTNIASKIDQVFNYMSLEYNGGEFFVGSGVQERFTLEMKLQGLPGQDALTDLLSMIGIHAQWLEQVIYHKFVGVKVDFLSDDMMMWTFDAATYAEYNMKDAIGDKVLWEGWPVDGFQKVRIVLTKTVKSLNDVVIEAGGNN